jgi:tRNA (cmo5U34)-methyltransferase
MDDEYHFKPETYLDWARGDIPGYDRLQEEVSEAAGEVDARRILELGTGTGETALRVLARHPEARLVGLDVNPEMLAEAHATLPASRVETLVAQTLQDPLPAGPFELVFSALAVHHLTAGEKQSLFRRVAAVLTPAGRFVLADVVVPERPEDAEVPVSEGYDKPDTVEDQLAWLREAGFEARVTWAKKDLAVLIGELL